MTDDQSQSMLELLERIAEALESIDETLDDIKDRQSLAADALNSLCAEHGAPVVSLFPL